MSAAKHSKILFSRQRGLDQCHVAFRQTLDLLKVADGTIEELCKEFPTIPPYEVLILEAMNEMGRPLPGHEEPVSPSHILLLHGTGPDLAGTLYGLEEEGYREASGGLRFRVEDSPLFPGPAAVVVSNAEDAPEGVEAYQERFPPAVRRALGGPIRNAIINRIVGDRRGIIVALNYPGRATRYQAQVLSALAVTLASLGTLASRIAQVDEAFLYLIGALARASEVNDQVTGDHILRVAAYVRVLAGAVGYPESEARTLAYSSQLHDVGKIHTPRHLLRKPDVLSPEEMEIMRQHTSQGERIIGDSPRLAVARRIAGAHHENWDGSGYPRGLAGEAIPREARLVKIVDIYDALRSERPYKPPQSHERACHVLLSGDARIDPARHLDPEMLGAFRRVHGELQRIHAEVQT